MRDNVVVTGGAGYIGSHTCKALSTAGFQPVVLDNMVYGHEWAVKWGPLVKGDIGDRNVLKSVFARYKPVAVLHFAAFAYVGESTQDPGKYYRNNVSGSLELIEETRLAGIKAFVFSSSCATYGVPSKVPIVEEETQRPINPYGKTKFMVEQILADYAEAFGLRHCNLRYFNAAGADPDGQLGEEHDPETHLIPLVLRVAAGRMPSITINGTDYGTPDGTCVRDYVHVADLADAHVLALKSLLGGAQSASYNLGNARGYSVREIIDGCRRITARDIKVVEGPRRPLDPPMLVGSAEKAKRELGWSPKYSDLDMILKTAWEWQQKHR